MKSVSESFEAASVQPAARAVNRFSAPFDWRLPVIGLSVFAGYYLCAQIGFPPPLQAVSGFGPLASEFDPGGSAFADTAAPLVVRFAGRISGALGSANAKSRSAADDFVLVRQQLFRSVNQRGSDALPV